MLNLIILLKANFLQKFRSQSVLMTLGICLLMAYIFIPSPSATYTTLRIGNFIGNYNSYWVGSLNAIMSSLFLSFYGYFLIQGSISLDKKQNLAATIKTSSVKNPTYLFSKAFSNFLFLFLLALCVLVASCGLQIYYNGYNSFQLARYVLPFLIITVPSLIFVSFFAIFLEVILQYHRILQYVAFVLFFIISLLSFMNKEEKVFDIWGVNYPISLFKDQISSPDSKASIGLVKKPDTHSDIKIFNFHEIVFSKKFMTYRLFLLLISCLSVLLTSLLFQRFKKYNMDLFQNKKIISHHSNKKFGKLMPKPISVQYNFGMNYLIYLELMLLLKKGGGILNILSLLLTIIPGIVDTTLSLQYLFPILLILQVNRVSDLFTKDYEHNASHFLKTSCQPVNRILTSRLLALTLFFILLSSVLLLKLLFIADYFNMLNILFGSIFMVAFSVFLGTICKNPKLFEILFIIVTYLTLNKVSYVDYLNSINQSYTNLLVIVISTFILLTFTYVINKKRFL